jgi:uncharacterized protein (DUF362 family)
MGARNETEQLVSLVDTSRYEALTEAVMQALKLIQFDFNKEIRKIAIKTNLNYYWKSSTGETVDPRVIEAIIDVFRKQTNVEDIYIVESDATVVRIRYAFKMLDHEELALRKGVKLINLCEDVLLPANLNAPLPLLKQIKVPETLTKVDLFISVPKVKVHSLTGLTCALKNQFGCIPIKRKIVFHENLSKTIAFINKLITPDLVLVDGIIAKGKTPKRLNLIMAGYNPVAVDFIAAKIAGFNPRRIKPLVESEKLGVGSTNVKCVGDDLSHFAKMFPKRGFFYNLYTKVLLWLYGFYLRHFTSEGRTFGYNISMGA